MDTISYLRQFRIGTIAIFDLAVSYIGIYLLAPALSKLAKKINLSISRATWLWLTLPIGAIVHLLTNQQTALNKMLLNPSGDYLVKIILIVMLIVGLKGIKLSSH